MKFGNRLLEQLHGPWAGNYLQYNDLKQILKGVSPVPTAHGDAAEGQFLSHLLSNIRAVDVFFAAKEVEHAVRLKALAQLLANPSSWLQTPLPVVDTDDVDLPQLVANIKEGVHVPTTQKVALDSFIALCAEIDVLRKYSVLNSLAITKIVKKHDKFSLVKLSTAILGFVKTQAFTTSRSLATTFTHAQLVASEVITAATATKPDTDDYTCSICLNVLNMPVVISCAHRFCYGCLSKAALHTTTAHHCPLCKKETDLDPSHYEIDPVLNRFVRSHFRRVSPGRAASPPLELPQPAANAESYRFDFLGVPMAKVEGTLEAPPKAHDATAVAEVLLDPIAVAQAVIEGAGNGNAPPTRTTAVAEVVLDPIAAAQAVIEGAGNGNAPPTRKRACFECHRAKAACEGAPCQRCTRLGKHCFTEERKKRRRGGASSPEPAAARPTAQPTASQPVMLSAAPPLLPSMAQPSPLVATTFNSAPPLAVPAPLGPEQISAQAPRTATSVFRSEAAVHGAGAWHYINTLHQRPAEAPAAVPPPPHDRCPGASGIAYALKPQAATASGLPQQARPVAAVLAAPIAAHDLSLARQQAAAVAAADAAVAEAELTGDADVLDAYLEWSGAEISNLFAES